MCRKKFKAIGAKLNGWRQFSWKLNTAYLGLYLKLYKLYKLYKSNPIQICFILLLLRNEFVLGCCICTCTLYVFVFVLYMYLYLYRTQSKYVSYYSYYVTNLSSAVVFVLAPYMYLYLCYICICICICAIYIFLFVHGARRAPIWWLKDTSPPQELEVWPP